MENSNIAWTDHTFNPWIGCTKVSPLCDNCYAEEQNLRFGHDNWGAGKERRRTKTWGNPIKWDAAAEKEGKPAKVFMASMADFFDNEVNPEWRDDAWNIVRDCINLDWIILTKRLPNVPKMLPPDWGPAYRHVTLCASMGNQDEIDRDYSRLLALKESHGFARVGISAEPLLEEVSLHKVMFSGLLDWLIVGGESGPNRRPFEIKWAEKLARECDVYNVPFFFKQDGALHSGEQGRAPAELWNRKEFPKFRG